MATCEKCNATFTPNPEATEVTSTRILCEKCEAERRAERLKRAQAAQATQPASTAPAAPAREPLRAQPSGVREAPRASAASRPGATPSTNSRDSVPPVPASKRPATTGGGASTSSSSSGTGAAPGANTTRAGGAPPSRAASSAPASRPVTREAAPSSALRDRGAAAGAARSLAADAEHHASVHKPIPGARGQPAPSHPDVQREAEMLRQRANKTMTYAWIACGVLAVVAGGVWFKINMQKQAEQDAETAHQKLIDDFAAKMRKFDLNVEAQAEEAIKTADGDKIWKDADPKISGEIGGIVNKARANLDLLKDKRELADRLTNAEIVVRDAATKPPDELAKVRRTLEDLDGKGEMMGDDFKKRVATARTTADRAYVTRLHDEAKAQAGQGAGNARVALTAYTKAEEEVLKLFEKSIKSKSKDLEEFFKGHYLDIIKESDALCAILFTPEAIEKTPWTDLLSEDQKKHWQHESGGFKGWRLEGGVLQATGPDAGTGKVALMANPETAGWRDFQMEIEFTAVKGSPTFCFRLLRRVDRQTPQYQVDAGPKGSFKTGQPYTAIATIVGSKYSITWNASDITPYGPEDMRWDMSRKGAFGITLPEDSEIKVTRCRIRELR
jgi:hypothetical protein